MVYIKYNLSIATFPNIYTGVNYDETVYYFNYVGLPETAERPDYKRINKVLLIDNNLFAITYYSDYFFECDMANIEGRYLPTKYDPKSDLNRAFGFVEMIKDGVKYINVYTDWHETINGESVPVIQCYTRRADDTFGDFTSLGTVLELPTGSTISSYAKVFKAGEVVYISGINNSSYIGHTYCSHDYVTFNPIQGIYEDSYNQEPTTVIHLETPLEL